MKKRNLFHRKTTAFFMVVMLVATACENNLSKEEILDTNLETISYSILSADSVKAGQKEVVKLRGYIDQSGEASLLKTKILESSGNNTVDDKVLKTLAHKRFKKIVKNSKNGKEVLFNVTVNYYKPKKFDFVEYDTPPKPIGGFQAIQQNVQYPEVAHRLGLEGTVVVQGYISADGNMEEFNVIKTVDHSGFSHAAVEALKKTKFQPAIANGQPVSVAVSIPIVFKLKE